MTTLRGSFMRSWQWAQAECRRRRKLTECIIMLAMAQIFVLLCINSSIQKENKETLLTEEQKKIGKYIVLYTTKADGLLTPEDQGRVFQGRDRGKEPKQDLGALGFIDKFYSKMKSGRMKSNFSTHKSGEFDGAVQRLKDDLHSVHSVHSVGESEENKIASGTDNDDDNGGEVDDDPVIGRSFQDEFVSHKSDGNGLLLVAEEPLEDGKEADAGLHTRRRRQTTNFPLLSDSLNEINEKVNNHLNSSDVKLPKISKTKKYKFLNYNPDNTEHLTVRDDDRVYFTKIQNMTCFIRGTDIEKTKLIDSGRESCSCLKHYYGKDCGIPEAAWFGLYSNPSREAELERRWVPRRVINGLPVNHEFAMFEARMNELKEAVDVFLIVESNYSTHGDPKELHFLKGFQEGYLGEFQDKIVYVKLGFFSNESKTNGWLADSYIRFYLGIKGLRRLKGLRDDDLFILSDADELPTKEIVTFLKLYDGYPEPIGFALRWNVFSFYWQMPADSTLKNWMLGEKEKLSIVYSAATIGMLRKVLLKNTFYIRKELAWQHPKLAKKVEKYRSEGNLVRDWVAGTRGHYAGWHCSWCFSPANIVKKMDSAQANDKPRWGDYPEKRNITYITSLLWKGRWFDDKIQLRPARITKDRFYAPPFFLEHPNDYRSLLFHPSHPLNINNTWNPS